MVLPKKLGFHIRTTVDERNPKQPPFGVWMYKTLVHNEISTINLTLYSWISNDFNAFQAIKQ